MAHILYKLVILFFFACLFSVYCVAQVKSNRLAELFAEVSEDEKLAAECVRKSRQEQITKFRRVLPVISGHCWGGCPLTVGLPYYPREAKQLKTYQIYEKNGML